jgi:hypothetical protein
MISRGDVCRCSIGKVGVVTSDGRQVVYYDDGNEGEAYVGICLTDGKPWSSREPERLCSLTELKNHLAEAEFEAWWAGCEKLYACPDDADGAARAAFRASRDLI